MQNLQTQPTRLNLPNQAYQTKPTKPNLPSQTYQTKPYKPNLAKQAYWTKPTKPNQNYWLKQSKSGSVVLDSTAVSIFIDILDELTNTVRICQLNYYKYDYWDCSAVNVVYVAFGTVLFRGGGGFIRHLFGETSITFMEHLSL